MAWRSATKHSLGDACRLLDNGIDALADVPADRRLRVVVEGVNGAASIRVDDTGPGVTPDAVPHLFEPFWSGKTLGTGLGLASAPRTMDAHGGRIEADVPTGGGMTFRGRCPPRAMREGPRRRRA